MIKHAIRGALLAVLIAGPVLAQSTGAIGSAAPGSATQIGCRDGSGNLRACFGSATSTETGTTVTTHGTYQTALAASATRKGCLIINTSADTERVFFGANGSATSSNSIPLSAGQNISCAAGMYVLTDNIAITSANTDGATYVVVSQ